MNCTKKLATTSLIRVSRILFYSCCSSSSSLTLCYQLEDHLEHLPSFRVLCSSSSSSRKFFCLWYTHPPVLSDSVSQLCVSGDPKPFEEEIWGKVLCEEEGSENQIGEFAFETGTNLVTDSCCCSSQFSSSPLIVISLIILVVVSWISSKRSAISITFCFVGVCWCLHLSVDFFSLLLLLYLFLFLIVSVTEVVLIPTDTTTTNNNNTADFLFLWKGKKEQPASNNNTPVLSKPQTLILWCRNNSRLRTSDQLCGSSSSVWKRHTTSLEESAQAPPLLVGADTSP